MQSEFNSYRGMRGINRDGSSRGGIPFGANRFMGRGGPVVSLKPPGMRNRETGGLRMGAGGMRDFHGGSFGRMGERRYFDDRDHWEAPHSSNMRNMGSQLDEGNFFPVNNFGPGPDRGRFGQNNSNFNSSDVRNTRGGFGGRFGSTEVDIRRARRMFQIPPGRFGPPPCPFPPRGNMFMPEMHGRRMRPPFASFGRNRRNAMDKNKKPQQQGDHSAKKPSPPWFDEEVFKLLKDKGKAHKRMKRSATAANVQAFKDLRKDVRRLTRQKYNDYCIKEGIPNKYTEAAKAKKQKAEEAAAKAALENNNEVSAESKEAAEADTVAVVNCENNVEGNAENIEENNLISLLFGIDNSNSSQVENPCDGSSLVEGTAFETTES